MSKLTNLGPSSIMSSAMGGEMSESMERPSYEYENKKYLLGIMLNQLGITSDDLEREPSWIKAKVRELNIDKVLDKN